MCLTLITHRSIGEIPHSFSFLFYFIECRLGCCEGVFLVFCFLIGFRSLLLLFFFLALRLLHFLLEVQIKDAEAFHVTVFRGSVIPSYLSERQARQQHPTRTALYEGRMKFDAFEIGVLSDTLSISLDARNYDN